MSYTDPLGSYLRRLANSLCAFRCFVSKYCSASPVCRIFRAFCRAKSHQAREVSTITSNAINHCASQVHWVCLQTLGLHRAACQFLVCPKAGMSKNLASRCLRHGDSIISHIKSSSRRENPQIFHTFVSQDNFGCALSLASEYRAQKKSLEEIS